MKSICLNFYGVGVSVSSDSEVLLSDLRHDFFYFLVDSIKNVDLEVSARKVLARPAWRTLMRTSRSTLYFSSKSERRVGFFRRAWVQYRYHHGKAIVSALDDVALYESMYYVLLSYIGERLDERGWHRIHGFGFGGSRRGIVLAPSGRGKSTLAWGILRHPQVRIFSDDIPIVNQEGAIRAFPVRIALSEDPKLPSKYVRSFKRALHPEKFVVGAEYFEAKISEPSQVEHLILLEPGEGSLHTVSKVRLLWPLLKWLVVGYETPQIWELYLRFSLRDVWNKTKIAWSRLRVAFALFKRSKVFSMGRGVSPSVTQKAFLNYVEAR